MSGPLSKHALVSNHGFHRTRPQFVAATIGGDVEREFESRRPVPFSLAPEREMLGLAAEHLPREIRELSGTDRAAAHPFGQRLDWKPRSPARA